MSDQDPARYRFISWMRRGIGATMNSRPANGQSRAAVQVQLSIVDDKGNPYPTQPPAVAVQLSNHGDVTGVAPGLVHITEPPDGTMNFEPNYLCYIEFFGGDFPWMFSPEIPTGAATNSPPGLPVRFQQVVHSNKTREADSDEQSDQPGESEWTFIRMHDLPSAVECN